MDIFVVIRWYMVQRLCESWSCNASRTHLPRSSLVCVDLNISSKPIVTKLHWLPITYCIQYKLAHTTLKILTSQELCNLAELMIQMRQPPRLFEGHQLSMQRRSTTSFHQPAFLPCCCVSLEQSVSINLFFPIYHLPIYHLATFRYRPKNCFLLFSFSQLVSRRCLCIDDSSFTRWMT